jgi:hypothetical protein
MARKEIRRFQWSCMGKINWAFEWWNDGHERNMYSVDD